MIMMQKAMLPGDETLQTRLGDEVWQRLQAYAKESGVSLGMYNKFKPGIVAMVLVMNEYQRQGFDPALGIDKHFLDQARAAPKPIRQLESIEAQFELFLQVNDQLDDILMDEMLDQMDELPALTERMVALWQTGDADGMEQFMAEQTGDEPEMIAFYRTLLDDRNLAMADSVDAWLHGRPGRVRGRRRGALRRRDGPADAARGQGVGRGAGGARRPAGRARSRALIPYRNRSRNSAGGRGQASSRRRQRKRLRATWR